MSVRQHTAWKVVEDDGKGGYLLEEEGMDQERERMERKRKERERKFFSQNNT